MKKQVFVFLILFSGTFYGCNQAATSSGTVRIDKDFYPIGNFIRSQLIALDSMPLAVIKYTTVNQVTDTSVVDKQDFKDVAALFMTPDIGSPELISHYDETSFIDATLGMMTLTYNAKDRDAVVRKADVLLKQDNTGVSTIYIEKLLPGTDSTVVQKLLWTANQNCQVTHIIQKKDQPEKIILERYVWDDRALY